MHGHSADNDFSHLPPRIQRMRERFFQTKPFISVARALAHTRAAKEHWGQHRYILRAKCIYHACETAPVHIGPEELIVGLAGEGPRAGIVSPDIAWRWIETELDTMHDRSADPYLLSDEAKRALRDEIIPFWRGRSVDESVYKQLDALGLLQMTYKTGVIDCEVKTQSGGGDLCPGYHNILFKKGFLGIKREAENRLAFLRPEVPEELEQIYFQKAVIIVAQGMVLLSNRYADTAEAMAKQEENPQRKQELLEISATCRRVPAHPPTSFREALQSIWFVQAMMYLEEISAGTSPGRVDQYVYPFLRRDLDQGTLTEAAARELLYCFLYKFNENTWPLSNFASKYFSGYMSYQNITLGGVDETGRDATNDLTYMILDCTSGLRMYQPSISTRLHKKSPRKFLDRVTDLVSVGLGFPNIQMDEPSISSLVALGFDEIEARDYCAMACTEPHLSGKLVRWASATYTNYGIPIEFVFTNGVHRATGRLLGLQTGPLETFNTYDKFERAVREQFWHILKMCAVTSLVVQQVHRKYPKILGSMLIDGCLRRGKDWSDGGAIYNSGPGILIIGIAEYANSMYAVKKLVFEQQKFTLTELGRALENNFQGYPEIKKACCGAAKYGNDVDEVDIIAKEMIDSAFSFLRELRTLYARMELSVLSVSSHIPQGEMLGALPSGRTAGSPLPDGLSPAQGTDTLGPTAAIKSVDKIEQWKSTDGVLYNMSLHPDLLATASGRDNFVALLLAHQELGGAQIQFNCVKRETLLDAQKHPERYRSLMIRVAGFSAYFTELSPELQNDIIHRTVQNCY